MPHEFLGVLPGLAWLAFFYATRHKRSQSFGNILRVFLTGCVVTVPAVIVERLTGAGITEGPAVHSALVSFLLIGPIEEFFKLLAVWLAVYRSQDFREPLDGIIYSLTAALGFSSVENIIFIAVIGPDAFWSRVLYATPAHLLFASMWGYSLGVARFQRQGELVTVGKGLLVASLLHGAYDAVVALYPHAARLSLLPLMAFMVWLMSRRVKEFRNTSPFLPIGDGAVIACPSCHAYALETEAACPRCGSPMPPMETDAPRYCGHCRAPLDPCRDTCPRCGTPVNLRSLCPPTSLPVER
ncbi:MAG: PrsW family glutamic-type intramembrane protease [Desulfomonilaceae bacterium]|nr:PrsW family glutamic-type intramembrane protease [Desulfomonilaceae bacterium]